MNDPHIQAFEIVSDRLSNLEEMVGRMLDRVLRREFTAVGELDNELLGYKYPIIRHPYFEPSDWSLPRQEGAAEMRDVEFVVVVEVPDDLGHGPECASEEYFDDDELKRVLAISTSQTPPASECVTTLEAGITSATKYVCTEGLVRRFEQQLRNFVGGNVRAVKWIDARTDAFTLSIQMREPVTIDAVLRLATDIYSKLAACMGTIIQIDLHPCRLAEVEAFMKDLNEALMLPAEEAKARKHELLRRYTKTNEVRMFFHETILDRLYM